MRRAILIGVCALALLSGHAVHANEFHLFTVVPAAPVLDLEALLAEQSPEEAPENEESPSPLVAAAWCSIRGDRPETEGDEAEDPATPTCDAGVGFALQRWERASWVIVIGRRTVGSGFAWRVHQPNGRGPVIAVAIGVVVSYDSGGIYTELAPALGTTVSFGSWNVQQE